MLSCANAHRESSYSLFYVLRQLALQQMLSVKRIGNVFILVSRDTNDMLSLTRHYIQCILFVVYLMAISTI